MSIFLALIALYNPCLAYVSLIARLMFYVLVDTIIEDIVYILRGSKFNSKARVPFL